MASARHLLTAAVLLVAAAHSMLAVTATVYPQPDVEDFCCQNKTIVYGVPAKEYGCIPFEDIPAAEDGPGNSETASAEGRCGSFGPAKTNVKKGYTCELCKDCCVLGAHACADPYISGFDGSLYMLFGKDNTTYSLISERDHQVNTRLCQPPELADGNALFIEAVGLMFFGSRLSIRLVRGTPSKLAVSVNGDKEFFNPGHRMERAVDQHTSFIFSSPKVIVIHSRDITLAVELKDNNYLDLSVIEVAANWRDVHGVMGQTHAAAFRVKYNYVKGQATGINPTEAAANAGNSKRSTKPLHLQGSEDDYIVSGLFGTDSKYNRFGNHRLADLESEVVVTRKMLATGSSAATRRVLSSAGVKLNTNAQLHNSFRQRRNSRSMLSDYTTESLYICVEIPKDPKKGP